MLEPGFQIYVKDPEPPKYIPFQVELCLDGECVLRCDLDTGVSDEAIDTMCRSWVKKCDISMERASILAEQIKLMRDDRKPR